MNKNYSYVNFIITLEKEIADGYLAVLEDMSKNRKIELEQLNNIIFMEGLSKFVEKHYGKKENKNG